MQLRSDHALIIELNYAHKLSLTGIKSADKAFYACHEELRKRGLKFFMRGKGLWEITDDKGTPCPRIQDRL